MTFFSQVCVCKFTGHEQYKSKKVSHYVWVERFDVDVADWAAG